MDQTFQLLDRFVGADTLNVCLLLNKFFVFCCEPCNIRTPANSLPKPIASSAAVVLLAYRCTTFETCVGVGCPRTWWVVRRFGAVLGGVRGGCAARAGGEEGGAGAEEGSGMGGVR
jgi:hypothetical protein